MRKTSWWIVLSIVITAASAKDSSIAAQRPQATRICDGKASPHEIEAHDVFRERFLRVALEHFPELELQPSRPRGPAPAGWPPSAVEGMEWKQGRRHVRIQYWRLASVADATTRLCWHREVVNLGPRLVKDFADEAYEPYTGVTGKGHLFYRRGVFFFTVSVDLDPEVTSRADTSVPRLIINPAIDIARLFLAAADEVLAEREETIELPKVSPPTAQSAPKSDAKLLFARLRIRNVGVKPIRQIAKRERCADHLESRKGKIRSC